MTKTEIREAHVKFVNAMLLLKGIEHAVYIYSTGTQISTAFISRVEDKIISIPKLLQTIQEHMVMIEQQLKEYSLEKYGNDTGRRKKISTAKK